MTVVPKQSLRNGLLRINFRVLAVAIVGAALLLILSLVAIDFSAQAAAPLSTTLTANSGPASAACINRVTVGSSSATRTRIPT